jgi:hypothetical protein
VYLFYWALFSEPAVIRRSLAGRFSLLGVGSFGGLGAAVLPLRWCSGGLFVVGLLGRRGHPLTMAPRIIPGLISSYQHGITTTPPAHRRVPGRALAWLASGR